MSKPSKPFQVVLDPSDNMYKIVSPQIIAYDFNEFVAQMFADRLNAAAQEASDEITADWLLSHKIE